MALYAWHNTSVGIAHAVRRGLHVPILTVNAHIPILTVNAHIPFFRRINVHRGVNGQAW